MGLVRARVLFSVPLLVSVGLCSCPWASARVRRPLLVSVGLCLCPPASACARGPLLVHVGLCLCTCALCNLTAMTHVLQKWKNIKSNFLSDNYKFTQFIFYETALC